MLAISAIVSEISVTVSEISAISATVSPIASAIMLAICALIVIYAMSAFCTISYDPFFYF